MSKTIKVEIDSVQSFMVGKADRDEPFTIDLSRIPRALLAAIVNYAVAMGFKQRVGDAVNTPGEEKLPRGKATIAKVAELVTLFEEGKVPKGGGGRGGGRKVNRVYQLFSNFLSMKIANSSQGSITQANALKATKNEDSLRWVFLQWCALEGHTTKTTQAMLFDHFMEKYTAEAKEEEATPVDVGVLLAASVKAAAAKKTITRKKKAPAKRRA